MVMAFTISALLMSAMAAPTTEHVLRRSGSSSSGMFNPEPEWLQPYARTNGVGIVQIFDGNNVHARHLGSFKARLERLDRARR